MRLLPALLTPAVLIAADACRVPAEVEAFHRHLPADRLLGDVAIKDRLRTEPDNFFLHRMLLERSVYQRKDVRDRYAAMAEEHPNNLNYEYLHARSLLGSNSVAALRLFKGILANDPTYPWVHIPMMQIYGSEGFKDLAALRASFDTFTRECPDSLEAYRFLGSIETGPVLEQSARKLRALLENARDPDDLGLYATLWSAEFRAVPMDQHDRLRKQVAADIERLRALPGASHPAIRRALASGARLIGDKQLEADSQVRDRLEVYFDWLKSHPRPRDTDGHDKLQSWLQTKLEETRKWREQYPGDEMGYIEWLNTLVRLDRATPADIRSAADKVLELCRMNPYANPGWPAPHRVAEALLERGIFLDRIPGLIADTVHRLQDPEAVIEIDLAPSNRSMDERNRRHLVTETLRAWETLAECYIKQNDIAKADAVGHSMEDYLADKAPAANADEAAQRAYQEARYTLFWTKAKFAEAQSNKVEALLYYREAQECQIGPARLLADKQSKLWKELGGTSEGWQNWVDSMVPKHWTPMTNHVAWSPLNRVMPPFTLTDMQGNPWTLDRLKGKTTFINIWATWCAPCRAELPYVQKLADQLKDRADVQLITFNIDDNPGVIEPFVKDAGFRFTVIPAKIYVDEMIGASGIPRNWIVRDGKLLREKIGFGAREGWIDEQVKELQR